jgi:hypothetical protein
MYGGWWYDTLGYTPGRGQGPIRYGTPWVFPYALDNLFTEGAYPSLEINQTAIKIEKPGAGDGPCIPEEQKCYDESEHCPNLRQCYKFDYFSPMVKDGLINVCRLPDGTAQLGEYAFTNDMAIHTILASPQYEKKQYNRKEVFARVIVHEMGHALLNRVETLPARHHCDNPRCIMYEGFRNFDLHDFGPDCKHGPSGSMDINNCILE